MIDNHHLPHPQTVATSTWLTHRCVPMGFRGHDPVTTHLTPRNLGCSPGAEVSVSIFRLSMWAIEMTVAATYQGRAMKEHTTMRTATQNRSRWYPAPFCRKKSQHTYRDYPNLSSRCSQALEWWLTKNLVRLPNNISHKGALWGGASPCSWYSSSVKHKAISPSTCTDTALLQFRIINLDICPLHLVSTHYKLTFLHPIW